jgi:hypothetical protein
MNGPAERAVRGIIKIEGRGDDKVQEKQIRAVLVGGTSANILISGTLM